MRRASVKPKARALLTDALGLPLAERAELAHELIASLDDPADARVGDAWLTEVERRLREVDAGSATLEEWSVVRKRIARRLRSL